MFFYMCTYAPQPCKLDPFKISKWLELWGVFILNIFLWDIRLVFLCSKLLYDSDQTMTCCLVALSRSLNEECPEGWSQSNRFRSVQFEKSQFIIRSTSSMDGTLMHQVNLCTSSQASLSSRCVLKWFTQESFQDTWFRTVAIGQM